MGHKWRRAGLFFAASICCVALAAASQAATPKISQEEATEIGIEAYIYLYPLITMDLTRRIAINSEPGKGLGAGPMNTFAHSREYPSAEMRAIVRPNFDTLYSSAWVDLSQEPVIISAPDTDGRYYLLPMLDMWTDVFASPGQRTSGTGAGHFGLVPRGWSGSLPRGVARIEAPTPYVWVLGRTQTNGPKDYEAVHKIQDGYTITPLSQWGKQPVPQTVQVDPSVDLKTPPLRQVNSMSPAQFFAYGAELMKVNPPHLTDWSILARMKRIGIQPGASFDLDKADPGIQRALNRVRPAALHQMDSKRATLARQVNGWQMNTDTIGVYGDFYLKRAVIAMGGLGANQPEDAVYPLCEADAGGKPLAGEGKYVLHFAKDELPPVGAFWSLTMYDAEGFQVANAINRFAVGDRDALKYNADGSLDIYIQNGNPGPEKESNWLPSPKSGTLGVTMRLYAPRPEVIDGRWNPPAIKRVR